MNKDIRFSPKIEYSGTVKLRVVTPKGDVLYREVHNAGTENLFKFISMFLCNENVYTETPSRIDLRLNGESIIVSQDGVGISSRAYTRFESGGNIGWCSVFRANIQNSIVIKPASTVTLQIVLLGGQQDNLIPFATVDVSSEILSQLLPGTTLSIEWILQFANGTQPT